MKACQKRILSKMIIPTQIDIQIVDKAGQPSQLANVLFGLKIFKADNSWHNYSVFKSDAAGHVTLTRQNIIDNTELKFEKEIIDNKPAKFELYVWEGQVTEAMLMMSYRLLQTYNDKNLIILDLKRHGVADEDIPGAVEKARQKAIKDKAFYEYIKDAVNNKVQVVTQKIEDVWQNDANKSYEFIIQ
jgi:hypothetical protein